MRRMIGLLLGLLVFAGPVRGQCLGDFNNDGRVSINEIITSVNNALSDCQQTGPTPTPTPPGGCPIDFADDNTIEGTPDCLYSGRWNRTCGDDALTTLWRSDTDIVLVAFTQFENLACGGAVTSATSASLDGCIVGPNEDDFIPTAGTITLADGGRSLVLVPVDPPFSIESCLFERYAGALTDVVTPEAQRRGAAEGAKPQAGSVIQRLRAARAALAPRPNLQRR